MSKTHPAVQGFMEAVYPGHAELALSCFNEIKALTDATETINTLRSQRAALLEALEKAKQFIVNGVEFGYIQMPKRGDPALETLPAIQSILDATKEPS